MGLDRGGSRGRLAVVAGVLAALGATLAACGGGGDDAGDDDAGPGPRREVVVALGDSFTSGEGALPYDTAPAPCRRSGQAWPRLVGERDDVASVDLRACAGAETEHLLQPWAGRDLAAQIPDEPDAAVTLVTLTIGGNDIGFGDIVATCVLLTCAPEAGSDELDGRLEALRQVLVEDVHPALAAAFPNARIVHVGYPRLVPPAGIASGCPWLSDEDQRRANDIVDALNATIESAAEQSGTAEHLDVGAAFAGHELCTTEPWVNDIGSDAGAAHPNLGGQQALARLVAAELVPDAGS